MKYNISLNQTCSLLTHLKADDVKLKVVSVYPIALSSYFIYIYVCVCVCVCVCMCMSVCVCMCVCMCVCVVWNGRSIILIALRRAYVVSSEKELFFSHPSSEKHRDNKHMREMNEDS